MFALYIPKRTLVVTIGSSESCQDRTHAVQRSLQQSSRAQIAAPTHRPLMLIQVPYHTP